MEINKNRNSPTKIHWSEGTLFEVGFLQKWNGNIVGIVFCHCGYEGCYVLNKIKVLISFSERANFFF
jgi:hypothetical protein